MILYCEWRVPPTIELSQPLSDCVLKWILIDFTADAVIPLNDDSLPYLLHSSFTTVNHPLFHTYLSHSCSYSHFRPAVSTVLISPSIGLPMGRSDLVPFCPVLAGMPSPRESAMREKWGDDSEMSSCSKQHVHHTQDTMMRWLIEHLGEGRISIGQATSRVRIRYPSIEKRRDCLVTVGRDTTVNEGLKSIKTID